VRSSGHRGEEKAKDKGATAGLKKIIAGYQGRDPTSRARYIFRLLLPYWSFHRFEEVILLLRSLIRITGFLRRKEREREKEVQREAERDFKSFLFLYGICSCIAIEQRIRLVYRNLSHDALLLNCERSSDIIFAPKKHSERKDFSKLVN